MTGDKLADNSNVFSNVYIGTDKINILMLQKVQVPARQIPTFFSTAKFFEPPLMFNKCLDSTFPFI